MLTNNHPNRSRLVTALNAEIADLRQQLSAAVSDATYWRREAGAEEYKLHGYRFVILRLMDRMDMRDETEMPPPPGVSEALHDLPWLCRYMGFEPGYEPL